MLKYRDSLARANVLLLGLALAITGTNAAPAIEIRSLDLPSSTVATDQGPYSISLNGQTYINKVCINFPTVTFLL